MTDAAPSGRRRESARLAGLVALSSVASPARAGDFASAVLEYIPAPGQFVNAPSAFNDSARALGAPVGAGTLAADNSKVVTLGGFGGSITLVFDETVEDDPCNPMGLDAIVFGNAFWMNGNPNKRWAEAAVVEISRDDNANDVADDRWYVVRGSSLPDPPQSAFRIQAWDNNGQTPAPPLPSNLAWYPTSPAFPHWPSTYTTAAHELPAPFQTAILINPNGLGATVEAHYGYADVSPTMILGDMSGAEGGAGENSLGNPEDRPGIDPGEFYTVPDDPMTVGVSVGSGGGDPFDIAWAVDSGTGEPACLGGFDFIRIRTGVSTVLPALGEMSAEIGGVADVRPGKRVSGDVDLDGDVDFEDLNAVLSAFNTLGDDAPADFDCNGAVDFGDLNAVVSNWGVGT